jgi:hypothetical protein
MDYEVTAKGVSPGIWQDNRLKKFLWLINSTSTSTKHFAVCFGINSVSSPLSFKVYSQDQFYEHNEEYIKFTKVF